MASKKKTCKTAKNDNADSDTKNINYLELSKGMVIVAGAPPAGKTRHAIEDIFWRF